MIDEQVRGTISKDTYAAGGPVNVLRISKNWGAKREKIRSILKGLCEEDLLKNRIMGKVVIVNEFEITSKGIDEYERRHKNVTK